MLTGHWSSSGFSNGIKNLFTASLKSRRIQLHKKSNKSDNRSFNENAQGQKIFRSGRKREKYSQKFADDFYMIYHYHFIFTNDKYLQKFADDWTDIGCLSINPPPAK